MILLLFPHQLLEHEPIQLVKKEGITEVVMMEDPALFGDRKGSPHGPSRLKLNRMRILYMRVATKMYCEWLQKQLNNKVRVTHISVDKLWNAPLSKRYEFIRSKKIIAFDPVDHLIRKRFMKAGIDVEWRESPCFLMSLEELQLYHKSLRKDYKRLQHAPFFNIVKNKLGVLTDVSSMDEDNRVPYPTNQKGPRIPSPYIPLHNTAHRDKLWADEVAWLRTSAFWNNPGPLHDPRVPLTHDEVRVWFRKFMGERFTNFGKYEDAVVENEPWMFHSGMSIYLNMGLIRPSDIVEYVVQNKRDFTINNVEGFLRQVMGWREYSRFYYEFVAPSVYLKNVFKQNTRLRLASPWYGKGGKIGIKVVDDAIEDAWKYGYLHHIRRLMVLSNFMTLNGIHPNDVFAWMYEFSLDSWDWVMVFNVYSMGTWSDGGHAMRKPYISSASYLTKMTYMRDAKDVGIWNDLFHAFLRKHSAILLRTQLAGLVRKIM